MRLPSRDEWLGWLAVILFALGVGTLVVIFSPGRDCFGQAVTGPSWAEQGVNYNVPRSNDVPRVQSNPTQQTPWQWSPNAAHHAAVVRVSAPNGGMGSGVQVNNKGLIGILTAAHIVGGSTLTATWKDGYKATGLVTTDKYGDDIAWVFASRPNSTSVVFSDRIPQRGDTVEYVGYGGPGITQGNLRHFYANATAFISNARVTFGDSGGPFFLDGKLIAIQSAGRGNPSRATDSRFPVFAGSVASDVNGTRAFLDRVYTKYRNCPDGNCQPQQPGGGGGYYYPPQQPPQQPYQPPQQQPPIAQQPDNGVCKEALALCQDIKLRIEEIRKMEGPPGKDGRGIVSLEAKDNKLTAEYTDGKKEPVGEIQVLKGDTGVGVESALVDGDNRLYIKLTNGDAPYAGQIKVNDGKDGRGIESVRIGPGNTLLVMLTDGTEYNAGVITVGAPSIDIDYLTEQVIAKFPPRVIQYLDENNAVADTSGPFAVNEPIKIPALRVRTYSSDGKTMRDDDKFPYTWGIRLKSMKEE